ncbi:hypothetical protein [Gordonia insulae]|uniref:Uncharacterized protein n=1 Tax=Gordonia insulae TaxID=2420509 RepID=A0A3G8JNI3_9ACTN|nr:hypothetical protein [Gordonia insulae]AZG46566.1 hypothetical protein D7316_03167 [Gordonia insulae]
MIVIAVPTLVAAMLVGDRAHVHAAPFRTVLVAADRGACAAEQTAEKNMACAVALTDIWLAHRGRSSAVRQTVRVLDPSAGVSWNSVNRDVCGYAQIGTVISLGLHHCNSTTFVNPAADAPLITTRARAVTVLLHESSHGVQEAVGRKPVSATLFGPAEEMRRLENASDCWSGAGWAWLVADGQLSARDLAEATTFMYSLPDRANHGAGPERGRAFERGVVEGGAACDQILGQRAYT